MFVNGLMTSDEWLTSVTSWLPGGGRVARITGSLKGGRLGWRLGPAVLAGDPWPRAVLIGNGNRRWFSVIVLRP